MGLFDTVDIENAADDPFALKPGRQEVKITKSEEDEITLNAGGSVVVWRMEVLNEKDDLSQEVIFWMEGDETQLARTHANIKKMLVALEIPTSEWASISENPEQLVGHRAIVNAVKAKSGKIFVNWIGVPVPETAPAFDPATAAQNLEVFAGSENRVGF